VTRRLALDVALVCFAVLILLVVVAASRPAPAGDRGAAVETLGTVQASVTLRARTPMSHVPVVAGVDPAATATTIAPAVIGGRATWYAAHGNIGAAGPALREYLGRHWRGTLVSVCSGGRCVVVRLSDWCDCRGRGFDRLIDLSDDAFVQLAPLPVGVIPVEITRAVRVPRPPATDTE
jgi:hypothetical protein